MEAMLSRPWLWKRPQAGEDTPDFWSATGLSHAMKREMRLCAAALLFATVLPSFCVAEYAERLVPMFPGKTVGGRVKWAHVVWDDEFPNAATADMRAANLTDERIADGLGEWANFQLPGDTAFSLTCKVDPQQDSLVCLVSTSAETRATVYGGCCADSILIKGKDNPSNDNIFHIVEDIRAAMLADGYAAEDVGTAYPSHTISVQREDQGALSVVVNVQYNNNQSFPEIGACRSDLLVLLRFSPKSATDEGYVQYHAPQVVRTVDGKHVFSPFRDIGTVGTNPELIREKVQFAPDITAVGESTFAETQYLITGNVRFTTQGGEPLLAYSSFYEREITILNDPWSHVDGAEIRQRFGRPPIFNATGHYTGQHSFGVSSLGSDNFLQVHNVWLTQYPDGIDTITSVWNIQGSDDHSKVFEFVINLQPSRSERIKLIHTSAAPDLDYPTAFTVTVLGFQAWFQGGAYPLSRDRMYLVSSGQSNYLGSDYSGDYIPFDGLQLVDSAGGTQNLVYDGPLTAPLYQNIYSFFDAHTVIKLSSPGATKSPKVAPGFGSSTLASSRRMHRRLSF